MPSTNRHPHISCKRVLAYEPKPNLREVNMRQIPHALHNKKNGDMADAPIEAQGATARQLREHHRIAVLFMNAMIDADAKTRRSGFGSSFYAGFATDGVLAPAVTR